MDHQTRVFALLLCDVIDAAEFAARKWTSGPRSNSPFATPLGVSSRELRAVDDAREYAYRAQMEAARMLHAVRGGN